MDDPSALVGEATSNRSFTIPLEWRAALRWGVSLALLQRVILLVWMGAVALNFEQYTPEGLDAHNNQFSHLPHYESPLPKAIFVVWRRWDAVHYLSVAQNGYLNGDLKTTVFPPLTSLAIRGLDEVLPGGVDLAGLVFGTLAFIFFLTMLYRVCETYFDNPSLAPTLVTLTTFLPYAYFFSAPMSEAFYMGFVTSMFYAAWRKQWLLVTFCGAAASLIRLQGFALAGIALLLLLEAENARYGLLPRAWWAVVKKGWVFALIPLGFLWFVWYRTQLGLPSLNEVQKQEWGIFYTNPLNAIWLNLRFMWRFPLHALTTFDTPTLVVCLILAALMLCYPQYRRLPVLVYTVGFLLLTVSKNNVLQWDIGEVQVNQSTARYSLVLFPLTMLLAELFDRAPKPVKLGAVTLSIGGFMVLSALHALGAGIA